MRWSRPARLSWPFIVMLLGVVAFFVYFSVFDIVRHQKTNSTRFDLGNMEQTVWNVTHGHGFTLTDPYGTAQVSRLSYHADLLLLATVPFYALIPRTETLLVLQVLTVASGGVALWLLARRWKLGGWWGTLVAWAYLLNPGLQWATIFDVHTIVTAVGLILWAIWAVEARRYWLGLIFVAMAMTAKEQVGLSLALIGLWVLWRHRCRGWGLTYVLVPVLWSVTMFFIVIPHYRLANPGQGEVYSSVFGHGAASILRGAITRPLTFVHHLVSRTSLIMAGEALLPFGGMAILAPWSLGAGPDYVINALSDKPAQHLVISHYQAGLVPWIAVGSLAGVGWVLRRWPSRRRQIFFAAWMMLASGFSVWAWGPLPGMRHDWSRTVTWRNDYATPVAHWAKVIPTSARVSATNDVGAHFARRQFLYSFPLGLDRSDYVVVLEHHARPVVASEEEVDRAVQALRRDERWQLLFEQGDLTIFRRRD